MKYKNELLRIVDTLAYKKMSATDVSNKYGNWNIKDSKDTRNEFIMSNVEDIILLISLSYKFNTGEIDEKNYNETLSNIFKKD